MGWKIEWKSEPARNRTEPVRAKPDGHWNTGAQDH